MSAPYATPTNLTGIGAVATYIHSVDNNFFNIMIVALWLIFYMSLVKLPNVTPGSAFTVTSWIIFILALLLEIVGVVHTNMLFFSLIMAAVGFVWMWNEARS